MSLQVNYLGIVIKYSTINNMENSFLTLAGFQFLLSQQEHKVFFFLVNKV